MLLILEIALTVAAWKRGWKALALLPLTVVLVVGFGLGSTGGSLGLSPDTLTHFAPLLDVVGVIVLGIMVAARKPSPQLVSPPSGPAFGAAPQNAPFGTQTGPPLSPFVQPQAPPNPFAPSGRQ